MAVEVDSARMRNQRSFSSTRSSAWPGRTCPTGCIWRSRRLEISSGTTLRASRNEGMAEDTSLLKVVQGRGRSLIPHRRRQQRRGHPLLFFGEGHQAADPALELEGVEAGLAHLLGEVGALE